MSGADPVQDANDLVNTVEGISTNKKIAEAQLEYDEAKLETNAIEGNYEWTQNFHETQLNNARTYELAKREQNIKQQSLRANYGYSVQHDDTGASLKYAHFYNHSSALDAIYGRKDSKQSQFNRKLAEQYADASFRMQQEFAPDPYVQDMTSYGKAKKKKAGTKAKPYQKSTPTPLDSQFKLDTVGGGIKPAQNPVNIYGETDLKNAIHAIDYAGNDAVWM